MTSSLFKSEKNDTKDSLDIHSDNDNERPATDAESDDPNPSIDESKIEKRDNFAVLTRSYCVERCFDDTINIVRYFSPEIPFFPSGGNVYNVDTTALLHFQFPDMSYTLHGM